MSNDQKNDIYRRTVRPSHMDKVLSAEEVSTVFEKCRNSAELTESACPLNVYRHLKLIKKQNMNKYIYNLKSK